MLLRLATAALLALALAPAASAAPPANDSRANAAPLSVGGAVTGTTVGATSEKDDPYPCTAIQESVWYRIDAPDAARLVVRLEAAGDLDAVVAVSRRDRSRLVSTAC